jgi:hypothetical protein
MAWIVTATITTPDMHILWEERNVVARHLRQFFLHTLGNARTDYPENYLQIAIVRDPPQNSNDCKIYSWFLCPRRRARRE